MFKKRWSLLIWLLATMLAIAACGGGDEPAADGGEDAGGGETAGEAAGDEDAADEDAGGEEAEEERVVTIFGAFVDEDARRFEESLAAFEESSGIDVQYEGSGDFETLIQVRVEGGDPPDIGAHPQPGLVAGLVDSGAVVPVTDFLDMEYLQQQYGQGWLDDATLNGVMAGVWYRANVKSLVWYAKDDFDAAGYTIPETWDDLIALSDQMVADGVTPWCVGIESSGATGWVATDWIEDIMLRTQPPEKYDQWVQGELPFNSDEVKNAAQIMTDIWFNDDYVFGGSVGILTTPFGDSPTPLFDDPPGCMLHRQASFIPAFFPDTAVIGENVDIFYLPPIDESLGKPVLTAGDLMVMYADRPEVREVMEFLTTGESIKAWLEAGGVVSPHNDASLDWYATDLDRKYAEILSEATVTRFDASDLMPAAVGAGSFWTGMVDYVGGEDLDTVMDTIDATYP